MKCNDIREMLALDQAIANADVQTHVDACAGCVRYHRQHQTIDVVLRAQLPLEAPETLTARLLAGASARTTCGARGTNEGPMIGSLRERRKRERQADILRVAWRLIGEKGYSAMSMDELAATVGTTQSIDIHCYTELLFGLFDLFPLITPYRAGTPPYDQLYRHQHLVGVANAAL